MSVKDADGKTLEEYTDKSYAVLNPNTTNILSNILSDDVARTPTFGANSILNVTGHNVAVKTGTTNDSRTCWFAGATPDYTTVVYIGRDGNQPLGEGVYPLWTAFPVWLALHRTITPRSSTFIYDPQLRACMIDWVTGKETSMVSDETATLMVPRSCT